MGADLYLQPSFDNVNARLTPAWEKAIKSRDRAIATYGDAWGFDHPDTHPQVKAKQAEVETIWEAMHAPEFYWRDSYNSSNLFAQIGLNWEDVPLSSLTRVDSIDGEEYEVPILDEDGCRWLINELRNRQIGNDYAETDESAFGAVVFGLLAATGHSVSHAPSSQGTLSADDLAYFVQKKARLIALCENAIRLRGTIEVSY